jgi:hypothetical protein
MYFLTVLGHQIRVLLTTVTAHTVMSTRYVYLRKENEFKTKERWEILNIVLTTNHSIKKNNSVLMSE